MALVPRFMCRLHRNDGVERTEVGRPRRRTEVTDYERDAIRELAEVLGGDIVHCSRPIEREVGVNVAIEEDLARELAGTRAKLKDAKLLPRGQRRAERGEEVRPKWLL